MSEEIAAAVLDIVHVRLPVMREDNDLRGLLVIAIDHKGQASLMVSYEDADQHEALIAALDLARRVADQAKAPAGKS